MENKNYRLGDVLIEQGLITDDHLFEALQIQKKDNRKLGDIIVAEGWVDAGTVARVLAETNHLPFVDLTRVSIEENLFGLIPYEVLRKHKILPIKLEDGCLTVATNDPLDVQALQEAQYLSGCQVKPVVAVLKDILAHIDNFLETLHTIRASKKRDETDPEDIPIIKLVESIISKAIKKRAPHIPF